MPRPFIDLTDKIFGRLTVIGYAYGQPATDNPNAVERFWNCQCKCGGTKIARGKDLRADKTTSCGCLLKEITRKQLTTHGATGSPEHNAWMEINRRCYSKTHGNYRRYGAKGITVAKRWRGRQGFTCFLRDMGPMPTPQHQVDRRDNKKGYTPSNCRWVTRKENCRNKSNNRLLTHDGKTCTVAEWAERRGWKYGSLLSRIQRGWTQAKALTTPIAQ